MEGKTEGKWISYAPATLSVPSRAFSIQQTRGRRGDQVWSQWSQAPRVVGAARLECGEPAAESGEFIRRQLGNSFGDFFDFHGNMVLKFTTPEGSKVSALARTSHLLAISFPNYLAARLSDLIGRRHRVVVEVHVAVGFGPQTNTSSDGV